MAKQAGPITAFGMYTLYDETQPGGRSPRLMYDAARPYVVVFRYHRGYKGGMSSMVVGRFATRSAARAAIRRHDAK